MKVVLINKSDATGGAAVVTYRLMEALRDAGVDARMLVAEKMHESPYVSLAASSTRLRAAFLKERLGIFLANGMDRSTLFKIDTAADGVPVWEHPWVRSADVICLNWVNQGLVSMKGVGKLLDMGKPVVWTMHDMWNMTGVCHHTGECDRWLDRCGNCPLLGSKAARDDISSRTWSRKKLIYDRPGQSLGFVAVSNWLAERAKRSGLLKNADVEVIPNAFPFEERNVSYINGFRDKKCHIVFGAARLDDPVKGLPILTRALDLLSRHHPQVSRECELWTFGNVKDPESISRFDIDHRHFGVIPSSQVHSIYDDADIVLSTSLYETLPGTLVEGQAWGCVPVATDRGGQADIITHRATGWLAHFHEGNIDKTAAEVADGIVWAFNELKRNGAALRHDMRESAIERFAAPHVAARYIGLFDRLLG